MQAYPEWVGPRQGIQVSEAGKRQGSPLVTPEDECKPGPCIHPSFGVRKYTFNYLFTPRATLAPVETKGCLR